MTLKFSTGLRNNILGKKPTILLQVGTTISFDAASKEIRDSGNGFLTKGYAPGDMLVIEGSTGNDTDSTGIPITTVTAGVMVTTSTIVDEAASASVALAAGHGGSLRDILKDGIIEIRTLSQAASADSAEVGTLLGTITLSGGSFTPGAFASGLEFDDPSAATMGKPSASEWKFTAVATGTAGHFRHKGNAEDTGALSTTLPRMDGSIGLSGSGRDMTMTTTSIESGKTYTTDSFDLVMPEYYGASV
jgi:hypothetical protein